MKAKSRIAARIHSEIRELEAYPVQPQAAKVKLDAMESPFAFEGEHLSKWYEQLADVAVNRYPDSEALALKQALRGVFSVPARFALVLGNGSDEILQMLQLAFGGYGRCIMAPAPSFVMYEIIARYTRAQFVGVDLSDDFSLPAERWLQQVRMRQPDCVFLAYPNNPTGNLFDPQLIEQTARLTPGLVVVDEAYHAYSGRSMMAALDRHDNLAVVRTLSKSGLAGLRVGCLIGHHELAHELEKIRMPYNVGALNQRAARIALEHFDEFNHGPRLIAQRQKLLRQLDEELELTVYPTAANFVTVRCSNPGADEVFAALKQDGILVKNLHGSHRLLENCLRLTVGSEIQNAQLLSGLRQVLRHSPAARNL